MYLNNNQANFTTLRINGPTHIHLSHGESEKSSMTSNQLKAYDYAFIAGQASQDRILRHVRKFDAGHLIQIGRPQLDAVVPKDFPEAKGRIRVLYAPTWEGDGKDMAYGSLDSLGEGLVNALLTDSRIQLIFRPHPKSGTVARHYARALDRVKRNLLRTNSGGIPIHVIDTSRDGISSIKGSDIVISDISAMSMDAIGLDIPLVLTGRSALQDALALSDDCAPPSLREAVPNMGSVYGDDLPSWLLDLALKGPSQQQRDFRQYVFGSGPLANSTDRFVQAVRDVSAEIPRRC